MSSEFWLYVLTFHHEFNSKIFHSQSSKCYSYVKYKQPRKSHKVIEKRYLAPLELIHSDICELNGVLTEGGKRYFMTLIDDATRFCYVYLLKTKLL
jgi:hypothetical protein